MTTNNVVVSSWKKYIATLRRAFLLRVHPDRFRSQSQKIRKQQAAVVQGVEEWMTSAKVLNFTGGGRNAAINASKRERSSPGLGKKSYQFHLQQNDGSLVSRSIKIYHESVPSVMEQIAKSLKSLGVKLPTPPSELPPSSTGTFDTYSQHNVNTSNPFNAKSSDSFHERQAFENMFRFVRSTNRRKESEVHEFNTEFDVVSNRGRSLEAFLNTFSEKDVLMKREHRLAAQASAAVVRRLYGFQMIDGTGMGWSSESITKVFHAMEALYLEHSHSLHVTSFYPLRLEFHDSIQEVPLDVYGGVLALNPSATPLQWLDVLRMVTNEEIEHYKELQEQLKHNTSTIRRSTILSQMCDIDQIRFKRGHSCSPIQYHHTIQNLANFCVKIEESGGAGLSLLQSTVVEQNETSSVSNFTGKINVIIESPTVCRLRGNVTENGDIRLGAHMAPEMIVKWIALLESKAKVAIHEENDRKAQCETIIQDLTLQWNLSHLYTHVPYSPISSKQALECLQRLLLDSLKANSESATSHLSNWRHRLQGQTIGIANSGQFCHIGDDGSLILPWDYR